MLAQGVESAAGRAFATYLEAAANFYSGRFDEAEQGFKALQDVSQPWLKETALYLQARTLLNAAQQNAFDDMGFPELQNVDKARLEQTRSALEAYLQAYPKGSTPPRPGLAAARALAGRRPEAAGPGLCRAIRRSRARAAQHGPGRPGPGGRQQAPDRYPARRHPDSAAAGGGRPGADARPRSVDPAQLHLGNTAGPTGQLRRASRTVRLPAGGLSLLCRPGPGEDPRSAAAKVGSLDYVGFSQQTLRGLALEQQKDWKAAEALWLELLPQAAQPYQKGQLRWPWRSTTSAAASWKRSSPKVHRSRSCCAASSCATSPTPRCCAARPSRGDGGRARYRAVHSPLQDLRRSRFADFGKDFALLGETPRRPLGTSLGYVYGAGNSLELFRWKGDKAESGYVARPSPSRPRRWPPMTRTRRA